MAGFARVQPQEIDGPGDSPAYEPPPMAAAPLVADGADADPADDPEEEVVEGTIVYARQYKRNFTVLTVRIGGRQEKIVGEMKGDVALDRGDKIRAIGKWVDNDRFGRQLRASTIRPLNTGPRNEEAFLRWVRGGAVKGLGEAGARSLIDHFGERLLTVLTDVQALQEVLKPTKAQALAEAWRRAHDNDFERSMIEVMRLGLTARAAEAIVTAWGTRDLLDKLRTNPWAALDIPGIGWSTAERIGQSVGAPIDHPDRIRMVIKLALENAEQQNGHLGLPTVELLPQALRASGPTGQDRVKAAIAALLPGFIKDKKFLLAKDGDTPLVMIPETWSAARRIALSLRDAASRPVQTPAGEMTERLATARDHAAAKGRPLNDGQLQAVWEGISQRVSAITGFAGSGKTTTLDALFAAFRDRDLVVTSVAGKAALRAQRVTGVNGLTIYRLLGWAPERYWVDALRMHLSGSEFRAMVEDGQLGEDAGEPRGPGFMRDQYRPIEKDVIVLDEATMPDIMLFARCIRAIDFRKTQLVMAGDPAQLLIGPGRVFADILEAGPVPVTALETVYRQAQDDTPEEERVDNSALGPALLDIREGRMPENGPGFQHLERCAATTLETVLEETRARIGDGDWNGAVLVMAPKRSGRVGIWALNRALKAEFNPLPSGQPDPGRIETWRLSLPTTGTEAPIVLTPGDPILQVDNSVQDIIEERELTAGSKMEVMNGTLGTFRGFAFVALGGDGDPEACALIAWEPDGTICAVKANQVGPGTYTISGVEGGYAMSPYKAQGSEAAHSIVVAAQEAKRMITRPLLYTGASRGKVSATIVGRGTVVRAGLANTEIDDRWSVTTNAIRALVPTMERRPLPVLPAFRTTLAVEESAELDRLTQPLVTAEEVGLDENAWARLSKEEIDDRLRRYDSALKRAAAVVRWDISMRANAHGVQPPVSGAPRSAEWVAYIDLLKVHHWTYDQSDNHAIWTQGHEQRRHLERLQAEVGADLAYLGWTLEAPDEMLTSYPRQRIPEWAFVDVGAEIADDFTAMPEAI